MNWREIFKRTGYVLIAASILSLLWWLGPPVNGFQRHYSFPSAMTAVLGINLVNMSDRVFVGYYFRHVRWVIFFCFLGGLPLAIFVHGVSPIDYLTFCFWVILLAFIGAVFFHIIHIRELRSGEVAQYLTPEQVVENLGKPNETISSDSGTLYLYDKLKISAPKEGGKIVERIPPPLPDSILGHSPEQIVNRVGFPKQVINLDSKIIYFYKDMKIIFIDGQVADVQ